VDSAVRLTIVALLFLVALYVLAPLLRGMLPKRQSPAPPRLHTPPPTMPEIAEGVPPVADNVATVGSFEMAVATLEHATSEEITAATSAVEYPDPSHASDWDAGTVDALGADPRNFSGRASIARAPFRTRGRYWWVPRLLHGAVALGQKPGMALGMRSQRAPRADPAAGPAPSGMHTELPGGWIAVALGGALIGWGLRGAIGAPNAASVPPLSTAIPATATAGGATRAPTVPLAAPAPLAITATRFTPPHGPDSTLPDGRVLLALHADLLNIASQPTHYDYSRFLLRSLPSGATSRPRLIPLLLTTLLLSDSLDPAGSASGDLAFYVFPADTKFTLSYPSGGHTPISIPIR